MSVLNYYLLGSGAAEATPGYILYVDPSNINSFNPDQSVSTVFDLVDENNFIYYQNNVNYSNNYVIFDPNSVDYGLLYITPSILDLSYRDFTIEILLWNSQLEYNPIIMNGDIATSALDWGIFISAGNLVFSTSKNNFTPKGVSLSSYTVYHICFVYDSSVGNFGCYINNIYYSIYRSQGSPITTNLSNSEPNGTLGAISKSYPTIASTFGGGIGTIRLYDKPLTADEVSNNYNIEILKTL